MVALDNKTALLIYSDFGYPDGQGESRKTIIVRRISVEVAGKRVWGWSGDACKIASAP